MFYIPAATLPTPVLVQETRTVTIPTTTYYALQPTPYIPTVPVLSTALAYPTLGLLTKPIVKDTSEQIQSQQATPPVKHVIHHYIPSSSTTTCCNGCELCCPWTYQSLERERRSRTPSPILKTPQRHSRRDDLDRSQCIKACESIDEKIERIRRELNLTSISKRDQSTETIDYYRSKSTENLDAYRPKSSIEPRVPYKQHYDAPKPRSRSRSSSSHRGLSLPRKPWRSTNQNDYPWRDAHLPAYREQTFNQHLPSKETAHQQSHSNTEKQASYYTKTDYVYRPKSESEARKYYIQTTGKCPDHEVYSALNNNATTTRYSTNPSCSYQQTTQYDHSFYSDIPTRDVPKQVNYTSANHVDLNNQSCIHIMPKHSGTLEPPYLKIYNAPVTYLH